MGERRGLPRAPRPARATPIARSSKAIARVTDEVSAAEGYRYLTDALHAALEIYLRSDAPPPGVRADRRARRSSGAATTATRSTTSRRSHPTSNTACVGKRGDAVYISVCVYGGPDDGRWSTRIVSNLSDRDITFGPDGRFEIVGRRERPAGAAQLARARRRRGRDGHPRLPRRSGARRADGLRDRGDPERRAARTADATPRSRHGCAPSPTSCASCSRSRRSPTGVPNTIADVWAVPDATYGWAAKDAHYAMGSFDLAERRAARDRGPFARVRVLGLHALEPVHADVRLPLRAHRHQRRAGDLRARRLVAARDRGARSGPSELAVDRGPPRAVSCSSAGSSPPRRRRPPVARVERTSVARVRSG